MENKQNQKLKLFKLITLFQQQSDEQHPLTLPQIITYLEQQGIQVERKSLYDDIKTLREVGYDLIYTRNVGYYLYQREYELAELKLLCDAVRSSNFITARKSKELIEKLSQQVSIYQASQLKQELDFPVAKSKNEAILYNVDAILQAIRKDVEIQFKYFDITVKKEKKYRRQSGTYSLFPYALIWDNQRYYCIGYSFKHNQFSHYRVDKMEAIQLQTIRLDRIPFLLKEYSAKIFNMYSAPVENMTLRFDLTLANAVFDQFGQDVLITHVEPDFFDVNLSLSVAPPFLGWLFQFGRKVQVLAPESLKETLKKAALDMLQNHS